MRFKHHVVPSWNEKVKACDAYWLWREIGTPRQRDVFNVMKLSRIKFKHAIRKCKKDKDNIIADSIAQQMCKNNKIQTNKSHRMFFWSVNIQFNIISDVKYSIEIHN